MLFTALRPWIKAQQHPVARQLYQWAMALRHFEMPSYKPIMRGVYQLHRLVSTAWQTLLRVLYWTPLFKSQTDGTGKGLYLYGGMPLLLGPLSIRMGRGCRISGMTTFCGRVSHPTRPQLLVGDNVDISWQTTIAVAGRVVLEDDVRMAGKVFLAGFPGHPLDCDDRARGLAETDDQVGDIVLKRGVWLATGVTVNAGVTIGEGTVVAAGSVVTHDLPPYVLAGGMPARVIRSLSG